MVKDCVFDRKQSSGRLIIRLLYNQNHCYLDFAENTTIVNNVHTCYILLEKFFFNCRNIPISKALLVDTINKTVLYVFLS